MKTSEKNAWEATTELMHSSVVSLGEKTSSTFRNFPEEISIILSKSKFAAKIATIEKKVLEIGCGEGLSTAIIGEKSASYVGVDKNLAQLAVARSIYPEDKYSFLPLDSLEDQYGEFEGIVSLTLFKEDHDYGRALRFILRNLAQNGVVVVAVLSNERNHLEWRNFFETSFHQVFPFAVQGETIIPIDLSKAEEYLFVCCDKKEKKA